MAYTDIDRSSDYFNTVIYTGDANSSTQRTVGFQPDFSWIKARNQAYDHRIQDSVRGGTKSLDANTTDSEATFSTGQVFNSTGFTIGDVGLGNESSTTYVSWNFLASNTTASNTDGSITSTVSASTTSGFSIVTYSGNGTGGATVGHGLGSALGLIILKCRSTTGTSWQMFHKSLGATKSINLEDTAAAFASTAYWNDTAPTSSVFSLGTGGDFNNGSRTYVAYCFAEKKGFSKFGSYTGNGSSDGAFVYTGFKPAFVIRKRTDSAADWRMDDSKRPGYNVIPYTLFPNYNNEETTNSGYYVDLLSNGFKCRATSVNQNASGGTYIYMAFAENPFVTSTGIPTTAR